MENLTNINWYPGHMKKAKKVITENIKAVDFVVEILDSRIPYSSRNPDLKQLFYNKKRILLFNKFDLADPKVTKKWLEYFKAEDNYCVEVNSMTGEGIREFFNITDIIMKDKYEKEKALGMKRRPVKAMITGIPNSGKSTFINRITNSAPARTGNKPGVTRDRQWIKIHKNIHLLDTPGLLWPKLAPKAGLNLALTGAINDDILDMELLSLDLVNFLKDKYPQGLIERYSLDGEILQDLAANIIKQISINRNYIKTGNEPDILKASLNLIDEFRAGRLGRISLEETNEF